MIFGNSKFANREDAGRKLGAKLMHLRDQHPVVLALPRGGVPVALEVAMAIDAPLDVLLVRKIGVPWQPELAAGAVVDGRDPQTVLNEEVMRACEIPDRYIEEESRQQIQEIERRRGLYLRGRAPLDVEGRTAIVIDDGIATGATVRVALKALRRVAVKRLVLAVPVAPAEMVESLRGEADEVVTIAAPSDFGAVGSYYADFRQLEDDEVVALLDRAPRPSGPASEPRP